MRPPTIPPLDPGALVRCTGLLAAAALLVLAGCDMPRAHGDVHAIVVGAAEEIWNQAGTELDDAISPTIQVVRGERTFRVAWQDPEDARDWGQLRRFRNVLVIGAEGDPWVDEALEARRRDAPPVSAPSVLQVPNVWARGQTVTVALLPRSDDVDALRTLFEPLNARLDAQYREFATNRMFVSGRDTLLADSLATHVGFHLELPRVYRYSVLDSVYRFRNDNPTPAELIREISISWVTPIPESFPEANEIWSWRQTFAAEYYADPQVVDTAMTSERPIQVPGSDAEGREFQAAWASPPDAWPAGGPTLTRLLPCTGQNRLYFVDAWLYAPAREKYEYMIQLETILDSFRCR
jgi:hypothetical protein